MRKTFVALLPAILILTGCAPDDGAVDIEKGKVAWEARDLRTAVRAFQVAAEKCPTNFSTRLSLSLVAFEAGEVDVALSAADAALAIDPASAEAHLAAGHAAYLKKNAARARAEFNKLIAARELPAVLRMQALISRAVTDIAEGDFDSARLGLWRAMRMDRRNAAAAWYHLGCMSRDTYHFEDAALDQFEMFSRMSAPNEERTQNVVRKVIPSLRASLAAAAARKKGVEKRDPGLAAKLLAEGQAALSRKQVKNAREHFAKAYAADPLSHPAAMQYAKALAQVEKTDTGIEKVLAIYADAIDANPSSSSAALEAARYAIQNKRPIKAERILSRVLAHNPESKKALSLYVDVLRKLGKPKVATMYKTYLSEL